MTTEDPRVASLDLAQLLVEARRGDVDAGVALALRTRSELIRLARARGLAEPGQVATDVVAELIIATPEEQRLTASEVWDRLYDGVRNRPMADPVERLAAADAAAAADLEELVSDVSGPSPAVEPGGDRATPVPVQGDVGDGAVEPALAAPVSPPADAGAALPMAAASLLDLPFRTDAATGPPRRRPHSPAGAHPGPGSPTAASATWPRS